MNSTQVKVILAPFIGIVAAWLASKIPFIDQATWAVWINGTISAIVLAVMGRITGKPQLADSLAAYNDTTVVTDVKTAAATSSPDVVANTPAIASAVAAAK